ncbi:lipoprotein LpqH family protein [Mycobacterium parascrofulaceum ATCC BAA-614]|uniref:Lipoprotein LpqH family protein n=2 Tax=Mycobacterium parascrofulaceum TaxID=240125 RepID=D5P694_9MYCO|nr:lipoprotein LpqH family protein [Mycobacterium parascrofulaceum ATCC BAA-614]
MMANIGSDQDGIAVTTTAGESPTLDSLVLGSFDGIPFGWHTTDTSSRPTVTKSGQTYKIVGTAVGPDPSGIGTLSKPFELDFTCPPRR